MRLSTAPGRRRTGPLGRLARFGLLATFAASLYSIVDGHGSARFSMARDRPAVGSVVRQPARR